MKAVYLGITLVQTYGMRTVAETLSRLLVTGSRGRMGSELLPLLQAWGGYQLLTPSRAELELTDAEAVSAYVANHQPSVILHLAAYTDVAKAEQQRAAAYDANVLTVRYLAATSVPRLIHISTDYVFDGERGNYQEDEPVAPSNYYSLTKALGEEAARAHAGHLIVRTSFKTAPWPYPRAFVDQYTGADYVDVIAAELFLLIQHLQQVPADIKTLHIVTERKSVFDLAQRRTPVVQPMQRNEVQVHIPPDVSLNTSRWQDLKAQFVNTI